MTEVFDIKSLFSHHKDGSFSPSPKWVECWGLEKSGGSSIYICKMDTLAGYWVDNTTCYTINHRNIKNAKQFHNLEDAMWYAYFS